MGCALGERPSLADAPTVIGEMTGDSFIDGVLQRLDQVNNSVFTAEYSAILTLTGEQTTVRVAQSSPTRHSVTIGNVRYLTEESTTRTCDIDTGACEPGLDAQRVSDTGVTPEMMFGDLAKRLRFDATAKIGDTTTFTNEIGGQNATCVDVPLARGTTEYCVLDSGVAARYVGADATLDLISYSTRADESLFLTTRNG
jgi:hypothetical protein